VAKGSGQKTKDKFTLVFYFKATNLKTGQNSSGSFSYRSHAERGNDVLFTLSRFKLVAYFKTYKGLEN